MNIVDKILALREGGQTQRCHTMQSVGPYNVAVHSFNALNLLLLLYPTIPSIHLIRAVLWHDIPERWTGDVPAPAKWHSPELKKILDELEMKVIKKLGIEECFENLTPEENKWLHGVDLLELYLFVLEQLEVGNKFVIPMKRRILSLFNEKRQSYPPQIIELVFNEVLVKRFCELDEIFDYVSE